ncbi:MAG TPA: sodium:alanine symporter family protein [Clostridiales bacterium]|nr:sodium:alanine symporter family protein [Clostridiales bacterium]
MLLYVEQIKNVVWGMPTVFLILAFGIYFTFRSRWFPIVKIKEITQSTLGSLKSSGDKKDKNNVTPFMAVATAIGGTVGVGSIVGVGYGIATGGAGSIFWMWVSGFFGMMIKYAEVAIAIKYRKKTAKGYAGGAMYCLKDLGYKKLGVIFCLFCISASIGVGNLAQTNAVSVILDGIGIKPIIAAVLLSFFFALIIFGGQRKIAGISAVVVPLVSIVYLGCAVYIMILFLPEIPSVLGRIVTEAFGYKAAVGGFSGVLISRSIRVGFARGVFSNEAGMGSSPIAHAAAENATPHTQGMWGIVEIFIDTFIVSTLTGFILLCAGTNEVGELFHHCFGQFGRPMLALLLTIFAFASMISWCFYSEGCINFLTDKKFYLSLYRIIAIFAAFTGAMASVAIIWDIADILNGLMIFPNMFLLFIKRKEVFGK